MQNAGEVAFCDAHRHANGEGHCEFESRKGMERALDELDGRELHGKRLKLREARFVIGLNVGRAKVKNRRYPLIPVGKTCHQWEKRSERLAVGSGR